MSLGWRSRKVRRECLFLMLQLRDPALWLDMTDPLYILAGLRNFFLQYYEVFFLIPFKTIFWLISIRNEYST